MSDAFNKRVKYVMLGYLTSTVECLALDANC